MRLTSRTAGLVGLVAGVEVAVWIGLIACGGTVETTGAANPAANDESAFFDAGEVADERTEEVVALGTACAAASSCLGDALTDPQQPASPVGEAATIPTAGSVCEYDSGPQESGTDAGGAAVRCNPGWECLPLNGHWACCTVPGSGGLSTCLQPLLSSG